MMNFKSLKKLSTQTIIGLSLIVAPATMSASAQETPPTTTTEESNFGDKEALGTLLFGEAEVSAEQQTLFDALTEEQIFALNQSLNGWSNNSFDVSLSDELLARLLSGELNDQQVMFAIRAEFEEAKFNSLADRMEEKGLTKQADRMRNRADAQGSKFGGKVDSFATDAKEGAKQSAKSSASEAAKGAAKNSAKDTAKGAAKNAAKENAKENARENAKNKIKENRGRGPNN